LARDHSIEGKVAVVGVVVVDDPDRFRLLDLVREVVRIQVDSAVDTLGRADWFICQAGDFVGHGGVDL